jgi:hypothetical protein
LSDVLFDLDIQQASQSLVAFRFSIGKTRVIYWDWYSLVQIRF